MAGEKITAGSPAPAPAPAVTVDHLTLRLPGEGAGAGRRVVERALDLVAGRLPPGLRGQVGHLALRVRAESADEGAVSEAIARALLASLEKHGGDHA